MTREEIIQQLNNNSKEVMELVSSLNNQELKYVQNEKWSAIRHLDHLLRSIQPLNKALKIPLPGLKVLFGTAKRTVNDYDDTVANYLQVLKDGGKAVGRYIPSKNLEKEGVLAKYKEQSKALCKTINKWKEEDLDKYILPHPLMGKMIIREILFFTIYHSSHHLQLMKKGLISESNS